MLRALAVLLVFLCASGFGLDARWLWHDDRDRELFVKELRAHNVPFRVDQDGTVWYRSADAAQVAGVFRRVIERDVEFSTFSFEDPDDARVFKERMTKRGIPFGEVKKLGREWFQWDKKYDTQVNALQEEVEDERRLQRRKANQR